MADGRSTVAEIAKDVKDAVGEMVEQGAQSVVGRQLTPQQVNNLRIAEQQTKQQDQQKLSETRRVIQHYKDMDAAQKRVREQNKQKEQQRLQNQQQEEQVKKIQIEQKKKQPINPAIAYAGKAEFKRGIGG